MYKFPDLFPRGISPLALTTALHLFRIFLNVIPRLDCHAKRFVFVAVGLVGVMHIDPMSPNIVCIACVAECVLVIMEIHSEGVPIGRRIIEMPSRCIYPQLVEIRLMTAWMQRMVISVSTPLLIIAVTAPTRSGFGVIISSLIALGNLPCLLFRKAFVLSNKVIGKVIMNINLIETKRVSAAQRIVTDIRIEVQSARKSRRIFRDEATLLWIVPACPVL